MTPFIVASILLMAGLPGSTATEYVVEAYFVVEPQVVKNYQGFGYSQQVAISTIRDDIDYFIYQVNEFFQSMTSYGVDIKVRAKEITMMPMNEVMFEECIILNGNELQADMSMVVFKNWLTSTGAKANIDYDVAVVWTGYDLFGTAGATNVAVQTSKKTLTTVWCEYSFKLMISQCKPSNTGYATVGATCTENGVAVVEFDGTMSTAINTAHEIAHSLGSPHVPSDPTSPCSTENGFIMNPSLSPTNDNRWTFSVCSAQEMINYISALSDNCLIQTTTSAPTFQMSDAANSDILDPEKICQRSKLSDNTYFCHYLDFYNPPKGDEVCKQLRCGEKQSFTCSQATPSDGMICDANKRCDKGRCVSTSISTGSTDTNCVFGDIESEYIQGVSGQTCSDYVGADSYKCYSGWVNSDRCCATCKTHETGIEGCMYGDHNPACKSYTPNQICGSSSEICCQTCHGWMGKRSVSNTGSGVDIPDLAKDEDNNPPPHPKKDDAETDNAGTVVQS